MPACQYCKLQKSQWTCLNPSVKRIVCKLGNRAVTKIEGKKYCEGFKSIF